MKATNFKLTRYDAEEGYVFDYAEPRYQQDENGNDILTEPMHLYAKTIFIGEYDDIKNYQEIKSPSPTK